MSSNLKGALKNTARTLQALLDELESRVDGQQQLDEIEVKHQPRYWIGVLQEICSNIDQTHKGTFTVKEFAEFYGIVKSER